MADDWVAYWDASAVIAALFDEQRSQEALAHAKRFGIHLLSGLGWAEVQATVARVERERRLASVLVAAADEALRLGPWRGVHPVPSWASVRTLSRRHGLRGADLWHLASCLQLREELPELVFVSFDQALVDAARAEGISIA